MSEVDNEVVDQSAVDENPIEENLEVTEEVVESEEEQELKGSLDLDSEEEVSEEDAESEEEIQEEIKELKRKLKLKVDGEEIEEEIDLNDEEYLVKQLQLAKASQKRMQETASLKNEIGEFFSQLKTNPAAVLADLGLNVDEFAEGHISKKIEEMEMSPEEKEQRKMREELEALRQEKEELAKQKESAEKQRLQDEYARQIDNEITDALNSNETTLPKSPYVVKRIAETMMLAMNKGYNDVTASQVLPLVEKQIKDEMHQMFGKLPDELLEQVIGKDTSERLRKRRLNNLKKKKAQTRTANQIAEPTGKITEQESDEPKSKKSFRDFFDDL